MAEIAPLTPLRFDLARLAEAGGLAAVVAPPYDVIDAAQRAELASRHPTNVVKLILPDGEGDAKYGHAADLLTAWRTEGALVRDDVPAFYRYDQTFAAPGSGGSGAKITRRGFLGLVKLVDLEERVVLPHERTLSGPKEDRLRLFRATRTNLSPGFMLYRDPARALDSALERASDLTAFDTADGIHHALAKITDPEAIHAIVGGIAKSSLLIADGHHRYETALRYSKEAAEAAIAGAGNAAVARGEHLYFMVFFANGDDPNLVVFPTHRHVHSLARFDFNELSKGAAGLFDVTPLPGGASAAVLTEELARAGKTSPSIVACSGDGRHALFTAERGRSVRASDPRQAPRAAPPYGRRAPSHGLAGAGSRNHSRGAGGEDEHLLPSGWCGGTPRAAQREGAGPLPHECNARRAGARGRGGRRSHAAEEHLLPPEGPHRPVHSHARARPSRSAWMTRR